MGDDIARNLWSMVCSCLNSYWTFHLFPLLIFFFQNCCFLHWIQSVYPHLFCSLYDNGSPIYLWSPNGLLCWWIFIVPEVVLNLVYLSIFSRLAALMSADIARILWSLVCSCLNSYWTFHLFPLLTFFFKMVAFCTEFKLFNLICFVLFMMMDLPYVCDHQVGYSAGGYSLSPRWFITWYIYPFFSGLAALMSADIARNLWSLVCSCRNSYWTFHLFPLLIFFQNGCFLHWIQSLYPHLFCSLYDNGSPLCLWSPSGLLCWRILIVPDVVYERWYCTKPMITGL